jgi:hypothetical protein
MIKSYLFLKFYKLNNYIIESEKYNKFIILYGDVVSSSGKVQSKKFPNLGSFPRVPKIYMSNIFVRPDTKLVNS